MMASSGGFDDGLQPGSRLIDLPGLGDVAIGRDNQLGFARPAGNGRCADLDGDDFPRIDSANDEFAVVKEFPAPRERTWPLIFRHWLAIGKKQIKRMYDAFLGGWMLRQTEQLSSGSVYSDDVPLIVLHNDTHNTLH